MYKQQGHWLIVDAMRALMDRSPTMARACVVLGGVGFIITIAWLLLGLFGGY